jgi:hypothetical protein
LQAAAKETNDENLTHNSDESSTSAQESLSKRRGLPDKMKHVQQGHNDNCTAEISAYLSLKPTVAEEEDPLLFWRLNAGRYPTVAKLAKVYLSLSASSVPVEAMFSTMGIVANGKRSSLSPFKLNAISVIHDNFKLFEH